MFIARPFYSDAAPLVRPITRRMSNSIWKYAFIAAFAVLILGLYPQISLWVTQGAKWNGSYFVSNYDEVAYSAYVNALINGEPRKNDPFLGVRDTVDTPQPETLYSIQFIPAARDCVAGKNARHLGIDSIHFHDRLYCGLFSVGIILAASRSNR